MGGYYSPIKVRKLRPKDMKRMAESHKQQQDQNLPMVLLALPTLLSERPREQALGATAQSMRLSERPREQALGATVRSMRLSQLESPALSAAVFQLDSKVGRVQTSLPLRSLNVFLEGV